MSSNPGSPVVLFEDEGLIVEASAIDSPVCVVTFTPWTNRLPAAAFGDVFLQRMGVKAFHFRSKDNHWWETAGMEAALEIVGNQLKPATRRISYGSSMGGFGAVAFGARLECDAVIAISPQASIDRAVVPWETRWEEEVGIIRFSLGNAGERLTSRQTVHLFYDDLIGEDRQHVEMIRDAGRARGAKIECHHYAFSGHPAGPVLLETGILKNAIEAIVMDRPFRGGESYRARRKSSRSLYHALLTNAVVLKRHPVLIERAARHYREFHREDDKLAVLYARLLDRSDRSKEALIVLEEVFGRNENPSREALVCMARVQRRLGNISRAASAYDRALEGANVSPQIAEERDQILEPVLRARIAEAWSKKEWSLLVEAAARLEKMASLSARECQMAARAAFYLNHLDEAEKWMREATFLDEKNAELHYLLGEILKKKRNWPAAIQSYLRAQMLKPDHVANARQLAQALQFCASQVKSPISLEMAQTALVATRLAMGNDEKGVAWYQQEASLLRQLGYFNRASQSLEKAILLDPKNDSLRRQMRQINQTRVSAPASIEEQKRVEAPVTESFPDLFVSSLLRGKSWASIFLQQVRLLIGQKRMTDARTLSDALLAREGPDGVEGLLCMALFAHSLNFLDFMAQILDRVPQETVLEHIPVEYIDFLFHRSPDAAEALCREWLPRQFDRIDARGWLACARSAAGAAKEDIAREILQRLAEPVNLAAFEQTEFPEILSMLEMLPIPDKAKPYESSRARAVAGEGEIHLGILNYRSIDYNGTSRNIGDHIQTLSLLSNLARLENITWTGDSELASFMGRLRKQVQADRRTRSRTAQVQLHEIQRDYTSASTAPDGTWLIAFGWQMHPLFDQRFEFPYREGLRPVFISFHLHYPEMLTDEAIAYLRKYAPIGCRDWNTVDMLRGHGVPAFFSGCLTSTIDNVLRSPKPKVEKPVKVGVVDLMQPLDGRYQISGRMTAEKAEVRERSLVNNLDAAMAQLEGYATHDLLLTSRLHCYLPLTSMGVPVDFRPKRWSDTRFEGLSGFDPVTIAPMRDGLIAILEAISQKIFSGAGEEEVYRYWREICAPGVAAADAYLTPLPELSFPVSPVVEQIRTASSISTRRHPENGPEAPVDVAFALDANLEEAFLVALESARVHASRPLRVWLLCRGIDSSYTDLCQKVFPEIEFRFLPCDGVAYGQIHGLLPNTTISTMDRLFLPELMSGLDRVVYLDIDILVRGDLAELAVLELEGQRLAATNSVDGNWKTGYALIYFAAGRLGRDKAIELRRRMHAQHDLRFTGFNAGVLVLNLALMRQENFCERYVPYVEHYGLNDQEVLNCYVGPRRLRLDSQWNCVAAQNLTFDAKLVHWAGASKPWNNRWVAGAEEWRSHQAAVRSRM